MKHKKILRKYFFPIVSYSLFISLLLGGCQSLTDNLPFEDRNGGTDSTEGRQGGTDSTEGRQGGTDSTEGRGRQGGTDSTEGRHRGTAPTPIALADPATLTTIEQSVHQQINQYRQSRKLPPLTFNNTIAAQARIHSERMAAKTVPFSHDGFERRIQQIKTTIPYQQAAENIAYNQGSKNPAQVAVQGWIKSPGHLKNIEGNFNLTGVGVAQNSQGEYYFTQIFIKPSRPSSSSVPSPRPSPISKSDTTINFLITLEQTTHQQVNQYRLSQNLPPLQLDPRISNEARQFSEKMALRQAAFSHDGFDGRVKAVGKTITLQSFGENLALNKGFDDPVKVAVEGWIKSPGHRKNMVGDFNLTGIGIVKNSEGEYYFTQLFVKKR